MKLDVSERINLLSILPQEGSFLTLKIVRELRENLSFTEEEHKKFQFKNLSDNRISWNTKEAKENNIEIGKKAESIIREKLEELDEQKKLKNEHFTLYEKFVGR